MRVIEGEVRVEHKWESHTPYVGDNDMYWIFAHLEGKTIRVTIEELQSSEQTARDET